MCAHGERVKAEVSSKRWNMPLRHPTSTDLYNRRLSGTSGSGGITRVASCELLAWVLQLNQRSALVGVYIAFCAEGNARKNDRVWQASNRHTSFCCPTSAQGMLPGKNRHCIGTAGLTQTSQAPRPQTQRILQVTKEHDSTSRNSTIKPRSQRPPRKSYTGSL